MISISLSPNVFIRDIFIAIKMIFSPLKWKSGKYEKLLENQLSKYFSMPETKSPKISMPETKSPKIYLTNSGRSALYLILQALNIKQGDEILLQAFTCNAVINPILWTDGIPIYVDIGDDYNIDSIDLEKKITKKSKAIIVQHTFGIPAKMEQILKIAKKYNLIVIEDCAHSLGQELNNKKIGLFGDISFFSFGRDKIISSVYGGAILVKNEKLKIKNNLDNLYLKLKYPKKIWILQQLSHPILMSFILPLYNFPFKGNGIGKLCLILLQKFHILSKAVSFKEKQGKKPNFFPSRMSNALAYLAFSQFKRLDKFNEHRRKLIKFYYQKLKNISNKNKKEDYSQGLNFKFYNSCLLRFPIRHLKAEKIIKRSWKKGILLGDWYNIVIAPNDTNLNKMKYKIGSCVNAEKISKETLNLPTNPNLSLKQAQKVLNFLTNSSF